jgi:hypothetical protein
LRALLPFQITRKLAEEIAGANFPDFPNETLPYSENEFGSLRIERDQELLFADPELSVRGHP